MPHTRAARLKALKEASDLRDIVQVHDSSTNPGWSDYLDWDLPGLSYQPDALAWFPSDGTTTTDQSPFFTGASSQSNNAANGVLESSYGPSRNTEFCGLQPWYSTAIRDVASVSPAATTRPQLSTSAPTSYDSPSLEDGSQKADQTYGGQPWSPKDNRRPSVRGDGMYPHRSSEPQAVDRTEQPEEAPSTSSGEENERINTAKSDANKKRKIAHSVIEKNYRSRIKDGMAELRHCVPSTVKGRAARDAGGHPGADDLTANHSSGKVAILSDAVQYVKALELRNEVLHGQLDVMQRRNNTLQKIALSKVDTNTMAGGSVEEIDDDDGGGQKQGYESLEAATRSKKSPRSRIVRDWDSRMPVHSKDGGRSKAVMHSPSLTKRHGSVTNGVTGTLAGVKICAD